MKKREDDIEGDYLRRAAKLKFWCPKFTSPGTPGMPDRIELRGVPAMRVYADDRGIRLSDRELGLLLHAAISFTELKTPEGRLRPRQKRMHAKLRELGFHVTVARK